MADITEEDFRSLFDGNVHSSPKISPEVSKKFFEIQDEPYKSLVIEREIKNELIKLKESFKLYVISSNKETVINNYFENNGILAVFEEVLGMESHKSKQEKFKLIFEKHNLKPDECVFVTDTLGDILEANKVGVKTIAVDFGFHDRARLEKGKPYKIISKIQDIVPVVNEL